MQWWGRIPGDTRSLYPSYDNTDPDFAINGGTVPHTKAGMAWGFIEGMRDKWGASVEYHNWAVCGTQASPSGGLDPAWLDAVIADAPDVVLLGFANGIGGAWQYANNRKIVEAFQAAGIEVIMLSTPRRNAYANPSDAAWRRTHDDLARVALDTGCAFVSSLPLDGPGREGFLSPKNMANGNLHGHGGPQQHAVMRRLLWDLVP